MKYTKQTQTQIHRSRKTPSEDSDVNKRVPDQISLVLHL